MGRDRFWEVRERSRQDIYDREERFRLLERIAEFRAGWREREPLLEGLRDEA